MEAKVNAVKELLEGMGFAECNVNLSVTSSLPDIHCAGQGVAIPSDKLYEVSKNIILGFL